MLVSTIAAFKAIGVHIEAARQRGISTRESSADPRKACRAAARASGQNFPPKDAPYFPGSFR